MNFEKCKMDSYDDSNCSMKVILESIKDIALYIAIAIFLIFKILKYLLSREHLKLKKDSLSVFNSIDSPSPTKSTNKD